MKDLLLISCSQKKTELKRGNALDVYNGPYYQIIKKLKRENKFPKTLDLYILSAKYGIIKESDTIDNYDQKMTLQRGKELYTKNLNRLEKILQNNNYNNFFVNLGKLYLESISPFDQLVPKSTNVIICEGQIGERMSQMKNWILSLHSSKRS
ncbi:MAG: peroxide stress protein YaaA [Bacillaceae bacterium]|nr:peroxide stress protein YaaA [Bacillaceae bacterium]